MRPFSLFLVLVAFTARAQLSVELGPAEPTSEPLVGFIVGSVTNHGPVDVFDVDLKAEVEGADLLAHEPDPR